MCVFGLYPTPGPELLKPWNFLIDDNNKGVFCCVNNMTLGKPPGNLGSRADCLRAQPSVGGWNFQSHPFLTLPLEEGRGAGSRTMI